MPRDRGGMLIPVLIFSAIFMMLATALLQFLLTQHTFMKTRVEREQAFTIAEAGLEYYKWFLAHYPNDFTNGTGEPGPYVIDYDDPEGDVIGTYTLDISGSSYCNVTSSVDIRSTGAPAVNPARTRTVFGRYARPTVADYAYILAADVWAGADRQIFGPYHSNGGIRMDGTNHSSVSSGRATWNCTPSFGCNPAQPHAPGVFGGSPNSHLWATGTPPISFSDLTVDLVNLKASAQADGLYFAQVSGGSPERGYRAVLQPNATIDVYRVDSSALVWSYDLRNASTTPQYWQQRREIITGHTFLGNYTLPPDCPVVFFEDRVWLEGQVGSKVTVVSADLLDATYTTDIIINNNITYTTVDGSVGLTAIAQHDMTIPLASPNNLVLQGIFIAQTGRFGRNHYRSASPYSVPAGYGTYVTRASINTLGTIVSSGRVGERWTSEGTTLSGYLSRTNTYHAALASDPPPLTPATSVDYRLVLWREE